MTENSYAMVSRPSLYTRAIRLLGFRFRHFDMSEHGEKMPGWMMTEVRVDFSFGDRVRLLFSGRLLLRIEQRTNIQVDECVSVASPRIFAPWESA